MAISLLLHVPPDTPSESVLLEPAQTLVLPVIVVGVG
jgi:hypothetical protein